MHSNDEFLLAFAGGATAMLAVAAGILTFLAGRAVARKRAGDTVYDLHLAGIVVVGFYALACDGLSWWAWCQTAVRPRNFLFGWPASVWLSLLFVPPALLGGGCVLVYGRQLAGRLYRNLKGKWPA